MSVFDCLTEYDHLQKSSNDLQRLFISALNDPSEDSWDNLFGYLSLLPRAQLLCLGLLPETNHYLLRILHQLNTLGEVPSYVPKKLRLLFPNLFSRHDIQPFKHHSSLDAFADTPSHMKRADNTCLSSQERPSHGNSLLKYSYASTPATFAAKKITTKNIVMSTDVVIDDKLTMERQSHKIYAPLPDHRLHLSHSRVEKPELNPIFVSELPRSSDIRNDTSPGFIRKVKPGSKQDKIMQSKMKMDVTGKRFKLVLKTGIDVVRGFAFGAMPCEKQEVYLNYGDSTPWDPYHLIVVPKIDANPTHFIATKFGFVHIHADGDSEQQSFAGWCRDSAVFQIIRQVRVFRDYLPRKMIRLWHRNVRNRKFCVLRKKVFNEGLRFYPPFMITMWKINSLCEDLSSLGIHLIAPFSLYHEGNYLETVKKSEKNLLKYFKKFWEYTEHVMSRIKFETESRVLELETQKGHMPFVSDIPISIQKHNHLQLEQDLLEAVQRKGQLEKLKISCQAIVKEHLTAIINNSVTQWMNIILGESLDELEGEESAILQPFDFTSSDTLSVADRLPCLFEVQLELNEESRIKCTLTIDHLRQILSNPLRIVEKCILLSTPSSITACSSEVFSDVHEITSKDKRDSTSSSSSLLIPTDLLTPSMIASIQTNTAVCDAEVKLNEELNLVSNEMQEFLKYWAWIEKLSVFLLEWGGQDMGGAIAEAMEPKEIELALMSGYTWLDKLSSFPPYFTTSRSLLSISTGALVLELRPRLQSVMNTVQSNCICTIHSQCLRLKEMIKKHLEILSCKRYDLEGFAYYAQQLRVMQEERQKEKDNLKRSSSLLKSLLASGVLVTEEVTDQMEETESLWIDCRIKIREMEEFVDNQTPLKAQGLQENMESCEHEIVQLANSLNVPPYTDPSGDIGYVILELHKVNANVLGVQSRLVDLGKWRQAITGHSHDMSTVTNAIQHLNGRKTLWNHKQNFNSIENEWLRTPFNKLYIEDMARKIDDLLQSIDDLFNLLPVNDPVLEALNCKVKEYCNLIPLLKQLSSKSVKVPHWHTLLAAVEEDYQTNYPYTLEDFILYKLFDPAHTDLILEVCQTAERELKLKCALNNLQKRWEKLMLTLQQKSLDRYLFAFPKSSSMPACERTTKFLLSRSQHQLQDGFGGQMSHLIAAGNTKEIIMMLEEDLTELQILKGVAQAESVKNQIEYWNTMLIQLQEIIQLLDTCQDKWWNTLKLFGEVSSDQQLSSGLDELQSCSVKFQEIMNSIHEDPFVFSLLERRRGQKGFRDLQGDSLQHGLQTVFNLLERVVSKIKDTINNLAVVFPRLLMLSDWEVLHLNSFHGNPHFILPSIRKMFPSIKNLNTIQVERSSSDGIMEMSLSKETGYQIVSVEGGCSESLNLCVPLPISRRKVGEWMSVFEKAIRYSLSCHLTGCSGSLPRKMIGNVALEEEDSAVLIWLAENVSQAIILAMECHIGQLITTCLDIEGYNYRETIKMIQLSVERATSYCIQLIRSIRVSSPLTEPQTNAVTNTLRNIILLLKHKEDILSCLLAKSSPPNIISLMYILYHTVDYNNTTGARNTSRLGSIAPSLAASRSSISQAIPAISRLQNAHEALVNSTKSLLSSKQSTGLPGNSADGSTKSIRSLVTTVPSIPTQCYVQCGLQLTKYGFDYHGNGGIKVALTPNTEKCLYEMMKGLSQQGGGFVVRNDGSVNEEFGKELALVLGRSFFSLSCVTVTSSYALRSVLLASLQIGCIMLLTGIETLNTQTRIKFNGWVTDIKQALDSPALLNISSTGDSSSKQTNPTISSLPKSSVISSSYNSSTASLINRTDEGTPKSNASGLMKNTDTRIDWYNGEYGDEHLGKKATIELWGNNIVARSQSGCIVTVPQSEVTVAELKVFFRTSDPLPKDSNIVIECLLMSHGFCKASQLSGMLLGCLKDLQEFKLLNNKILAASKRIVKYGHDYLTEAMKTTTVPVTIDDEAEYVIKGLSRFLSTEFINGMQQNNNEEIVKTLSKWFKLNDFDLNVHLETKEKGSLLTNIITRQLDDAHLHMNQTIIDKIVQLHCGLINKKCAILTGTYGSGKTTVHQTLVKAYNSLNNNPLIGGHVHVHVINPAAYNSDEFFGCYQSASSSQWQPGLFPKLLQNLSNLQYTKTLLSVKDPSNTNTIEHWVILDGTISETLMEWITGLLTDSQTILLPNGDTLSLPEHCRLIIETPSVDLTPSILPCCVHVHCDSLFTYKDVITTWLRQASTLHDLSTSGIEILSSLMNSALPKLIQFVSMSGNDLLNHVKSSSINIDTFLTHKFLSLLSSVLERNSPKQNDTSSSCYTGTTSSRVSNSVTSLRVSRIGSIPNISSSVDATSSVHAFAVERDDTRQSSFASRPSLDDQCDTNERDEVLSEYSDIDTHIFRNQQYHTSAMFMFTVVWSFGAYIPHSDIGVFSDLIRELASNLPTCQNMFPPGGSVFDYYLDLKTYCFTPWNQKKQERKNSITDKQYITVPELERYAYICDLYLSYGNSVILVGDQGSGKTSFVKNMIQSRTTSTTVYQISHMMTSSSLHSSIIARLLQLKRRQGPGGVSKRTISQRNTFLIDDLHLASKITLPESNNSSFDVANNSNKECFDVANNSNKECFDDSEVSSIIEMFSMIAEHKIIPDTTRDYIHSLKGIRLLATSTSIGTRKLSLKILRHFNAVPFFPLSNHSLQYVVRKRLSPWIRKFSFENEEKNEAICNGLAVACVTVFRNMASRFNPSATNPHLLFSLRDLAAVWEGLLLMSTAQIEPVGSLLARRGLIGLKESQSKERRVTAGRTNTSKTKSGKPGVTSSGRKGNQTGRGIRKLPSLTESEGLKNIESKHRHQRQRTLPSGLERVVPRGSSQNSFLSASLPVDIRGRTGNEERGKRLGLLRGMLRLWCHEVSRVYGDRLTDSRDKIWMMKLIETCCKYCFCGSEIEDSVAATDRSSMVTNKSVGRRDRPIRPRGGGAVKIADGNTGIVQTPAMKLQATTLIANGVLYDSMTDLLPKDKQIELINYDDFAVKGEDLTSLMFAKLPLSKELLDNGVQENSPEHRKFTNYVEIGDGQVKDTINDILDEQATKQTMIGHMVMSKQSMEHVIRLCRALVIPQTHCLLLGQRAVGKKMVTRLAAEMLDATIYELDHNNTTQSNSILRNVCMTAGLDRQKVILLVDASNESQNDGYWKQVLELMSEGLVADLFSSSEILIMSNKINTEKLRRTTDSAFQGFADVVKSNLHVVVTWITPYMDVFTIKTYSSAHQYDPRFIMEENWVNLFQSVLRSCSYVDKYQIWAKDSYSEIALQFWAKKKLLKRSSMNSSDLEALSYLAAHIHLTAVGVLQTTLPDNINRWIGTPGDYVQCLRNAFNFYEDLKKNGEDKVHKLHSSLSHLYDLEREVNNLEYKLESDLQPRLEKAENDVTHHKELITMAKERYMASYDRCKKAEETIDRETECVKKFKKLVDEKFQEISPTYNSAIETLSSIERSVVMEVMGYRAPTTHLLPVFEGLCLLFDRPPTWEDCHQLMLSHRFYESLRFFDKDNVSQKKLNKLEVLLANQKKIYLPRMAEISQAVVPIVLWIAALVDYRKAKSAVQPFRDQLNQAEEMLSTAQEVYVTMRHNMITTKDDLEIQHVQHKEAVKIFKAIKEDVQEVQDKVASIQRLLNSLLNQKKIWEGRLTDTQMHLDCLPAESLLISAMATYCNPLVSNLHNQLWSNWMRYCQGKVSIGSLTLGDDANAHKINIRIERDFNIQNVLAESDELLGLERREVFSDTASLEKALLWKLQMKQRKIFIQVLFDPDCIARHYIHKLYIDDDEDTPSDHVIIIQSDSTNLTDKLINCIQQGAITVLQVTSPINTNGLCSIIESLLSCSQPAASQDKFISLNSETILPHSNFKLFIILPYHTNSQHCFVLYVLRAFSSEHLSNLELSQQGLSTLLHRHIIEESRREMSIQRRALLADLIIHKQSVLESEESIMSSITQINCSETLIRSIQDNEANRTGSISQVTDTEQGLSDITKHIKPYKKLADHFAIMYLSYQRLSRVCPQVSVSTDDMRKILTDILNQRDNSQIYFSRTSLPAILQHLEHSSLLKLLKHISPSLFSYQQLLFLLLVSMSSTGRIVNDEVQVLLQKPIHFPILEALEITSVATGEVSSNEFLHFSALSHVKSEAFLKIVESMREYNDEWNEYFEAPPSLILPFPVNEEQSFSSLVEKLTIWKIFQPSKFTEAVKSYVTLSMGPEFTVPILPDVSHDCSSPTFCVYKSQCGNSATKTLLSSLDPDNVIIISTLDVDFIDQISHLVLRESSTVIVVDHILSSDACLDQIIETFKILNSSKSNPALCLYIPIPEALLSKLSDNLTHCSYRVIALPNNQISNTSSLLLTDLHKLCNHAAYDSHQENVEYMKKVVDKLYQSFAASTRNCKASTCTSINVERDLIILNNYLHGRESYSVCIGYLLSCVSHNAIPDEWRCSKHECSNLIDYYRLHL